MELDVEEEGVGTLPGGQAGPARLASSCSRGTPSAAASPAPLPLPLSPVDGSPSPAQQHRQQDSPAHLPAPMHADQPTAEAATLPTPFDQPGVAEPTITLSSQEAWAAVNNMFGVSGQWVGGGLGGPGQWWQTA